MNVGLILFISSLLAGSPDDKPANSPSEKQKIIPKSKNGLIKRVVTLVSAVMLKKLFFRMNFMLLHHW